jgi:hypothetical protein
VGGSTNTNTIWALIGMADAGLACCLWWVCHGWCMVGHVVHAACSWSQCRPAKCLLLLVPLPLPCSQPAVHGQEQRGLSEDFKLANRVMPAPHFSAVRPSLFKYSLSSYEGCNLCQ